MEKIDVSVAQFTGCSKCMQPLPSLRCSLHVEGSPEVVRLVLPDQLHACDPLLHSNSAYMWKQRAGSAKEHEFCMNPVVVFG